MKKINIKQIIIMGIPITILSLPLIYFLLLNYGIVKQTNIGIFSLPILDTFRVEQISAQNILKTCLSSLKVIFLTEGTIYLMYVPLFIIGYIYSFKEVIMSIKEKKFNITTIMVISFTTLLVGLLCAGIPTANKANVLYFPILYFVAIAIIKICNNSYFSKIIIGLTILALFINFQIYYYSFDGINGDNWYEDKYLYNLTKEIEGNKEFDSVKKYVISMKAAPYIYVLLGNKMSPQEYIDTEVVVDYGYRVEVTQIGNYNFIYKEEEFKEALKNEENKMFIISECYKTYIDELKRKGYNEQDYGYYVILF